MFSRAPVGVANRLFKPLPCAVQPYPGARLSHWLDINYVLLYYIYVYERDHFGTSQPADEAEPSVGQVEALSSLELKEVINSLFVEQVADISEVLDFIERTLAAEPVPKTGDVEEEDEYNAKMKELARLAQQYQGRARELEILAEEIRSRTSSDTSL
jgi:hypothetical protein